VPSDRANHGQRDAGVPASSVEDDPAGIRQQTGLLGGEHHPERGPILHRAAGVRGLDLRPELGAQAAAEAPQGHERGVADPFQDRSAHERADALAVQPGGGDCGRIVDRGSRHYGKEDTRRRSEQLGEAQRPLPALEDPVTLEQGGQGD
jgi:hypothetical protein